MCDFSLYESNFLKKFKKCYENFVALHVFMEKLFNMALSRDLLKQDKR